MNFLNKILILLPSLILLYGGSQNGFSQDTLKVRLYPTTNIDVCAIEKRILIEVQTNEIYSKDSLLGYDFIIEYDPSNIVIEQALAASTLTSQIINGGGFSHFRLLEPGVFRASAYLPDDSPFIKGIQPLVVFSGRYIGECEGIASIRITSFEPVFYSFTSTKILDYDKENYIIGEVADFNDRVMKVQFEEKSIEIGKNDTIRETDVSFKFNQDSKITNAKIVFNLDSANLIQILSVVSIQNNLLLDSVRYEKDKTEIKVRFKENYVNNLPSLRLKIKSETDDNFQTHLIAKIIETNKCNCVKIWDGDKIAVTKLKADTVISVNEEKIIGNLNIEFVAHGGTYKIISKELITEYAVYNSLGSTLRKIILDEPTLEINIPNSIIQSGMYFIEVVTKTENKKNYIKFIK